MEKLMAIINLFPSFLIIAAGIGACLWWRKREKDRIDAIGEDIGEEAVAWQRIQQWLRIATFAFVTDAEREYGAASGMQKQSDVLARVIEMLPPELRGRIRADVLREFIEDVLEEAKEQWMENDALLRTGIEAELSDIQPVRLIAAKDIAAGDAVDIVTAFAPVESGGPDDNDPIGIAEKTLRRECKKKGLCCAIEIGTPCGSGAQGEPGDPGVPDDALYPVGHHWEPGGNGGFVSVPDVPAEEDAA